MLQFTHIRWIIDYLGLVNPSFMSSHMQSLPTPYIEETGIMSPSTGYFPNTGDTDHMSTIPSPQDFNVDFNDLIL